LTKQKLLLETKIGGVLSIYDEKKSKNNHNDCDLDFGDYSGEK